MVLLLVTLQKKPGLAAAWLALMAKITTCCKKSLRFPGYGRPHLAGVFLPE
jgi:hypothetical protein